MSLPGITAKCVCASRSSFFTLSVKMAAKAVQHLEWLLDEHSARTVFPDRLQPVHDEIVIHPPFFWRRIMTPFRNASPLGIDFRLKTTYGDSLPYDDICCHMAPYDDIWRQHNCASLTLCTSRADKHTFLAPSPLCSFLANQTARESDRRSRVETLGSRAACSCRSHTSNSSEPFPYTQGEAAGTLSPFVE